MPLSILFLCHSSVSVLYTMSFSSLPTLLFNIGLLTLVLITEFFHSNAKHGGGTVIPHLNFSIPCAALKPILKFSEGNPIQMFFPIGLFTQFNKLTLVKVGEHPKSMNSKFTISTRGYSFLDHCLLNPYFYAFQICRILRF